MNYKTNYTQEDILYYGGPALLPKELKALNYVCEHLTYDGMLALARAIKGLAETKEKIVFGFKG